MKHFPSWILALLLAGCSSADRVGTHLERAEAYEADGQIDEAVIEYLNVIESDSDHPMAVRRLARLYVKQGDAPAAYRYLSRALELDPEDHESRVHLATLLAAGGEPAAALDEVDRVLARDPEHPRALMLQCQITPPGEALDAVRDRLAAAAVPEELEPDRQLALAMASVRQGRGDEARALFLALLEEDPDRADAHLGLGLIALQRKDLEAAERHYRRAAELSPPGSPTRIRYALLKIRRGDLDGARGVLEDILDTHPDSLAVLHPLAIIELESGNLPAAEAILERMKDAGPESPAVLLLQGRIDFARGRYGEAETVFSRLVDLQPTGADLRLRLAMALAAQQKNQAAIRELTRLLADHPGHLGGSALLGELYLRTGDAREAIDPLERVYSVQPDNPAAARLLAIACQAAGRSDRAAEVFLELEALAPDDAEIRYRYGMTLLGLGEREAAIRRFEIARGLDPRFLPALEALVAMEVQAGDRSAGMQRLRDALEATPDLAGARERLARLLLQDGKPEEATRLLSEAIDLDPSRSEPFQLLAAVYSASGNLASAIDEMQRAVDATPDSPSMRLLLAMLHEQAGDPAAAIEQYEHALDLDPGYGAAANNLAYLYSLDPDRLDRAYELARAAHERFPDNPYLADTLGWILHLQGDNEWALTLLTKSAAAFPDQPEVAYHLGRVCLALGREEDAIRRLERAARSDSPYPGSDTVEGLLGMLAMDPDRIGPNALPEIERHLQEFPGMPALQLRRAAALEARGDYAAARAAYEEIRERHPGYAPATWRLAGLLSDRFDEQEAAMELARLARQQAPTQVRALATLGRVAYRTGDANWAVSLLSEAAASHPDDASVAFDLGQAQYASGDVNTAIATVGDALDRGLDGPARLAAQRFLALARAAEDGSSVTGMDAGGASVTLAGRYAAASRALADGDEQAALARLEDIVSRHPEFTPASLRLARIYLDRPGGLDKAKTLVQAVRTRQPGDAVAMALLGAVALAEGDLPYAEQLLRQSLETAPDRAETWQALGMCLEQAGDTEQARAAHQRAKSLESKGK